jgi:hypothetical protein
MMALSLEEVARHVNWYSDPARLLANLDLFLCQVMARGSVDDIITVQKRFSREDFEKAYRHAPPGLFTKRAWAYWGLMLEVASRPLPERFPGANRFDWRKST